ncbi:MAG: transposase [Planctomycetota bacterium]
MSRIRRIFDSTQKANAVRRHLKDGIPVSELAKELDVQPSQIHQWINTALTQIESARSYPCLRCAFRYGPVARTSQSSLFARLRRKAAALSWQPLGSVHGPGLS